jgi:hypothetical protein
MERDKERENALVPYLVFSLPASLRQAGRSLSLLFLSHASFLAKLHQHAVGAFGVEEANEFVVGAGFGFFVEQCKSFGLEPFHFGYDIIHIKSDMVNAFSAFLDELRDGRFGVGGFEQFDFIFSRQEKGSRHAFAFHHFGFVVRGAEEFGEELVRLSKIFDSDADVFDFVHDRQI